MFGLQRGSIWSLTLGGLNSPLDQRLGGKLLGLPQELEELGLLQELQILGLATLEEESQNLGAAE